LLINHKFQFHLILPLKQQDLSMLSMNGFIRHTYRSLLSYESRLWLYKHRHKKEYELLRKSIHPSSKGDFSLKPFDEHKSIFIHITKTAGTSIAKALFGYLPYHYTAIDYRVIYGRKLFDQYFKFAFVRNPWDRLYSAYRYLKAGGWNDDDKVWAQDNLSQYESFQSFVKQWLTKDNINKHKHFWPQSRFICDESNNLLIDHLAYFETINDDYDVIKKKLSTGQDIGHNNANPGNSYREAYDDESRDIVAEIYATDIALFGYDFDGIRQRNNLS
jgi:hypothetical protein